MKTNVTYHKDINQTTETLNWFEVPTFNDIMKPNHHAFMIKSVDKGKKRNANLISNQNFNKNGSSLHYNKFGGADEDSSRIRSHPRKLSYASSISTSRYTITKMNKLDG